MTRRDILDTKGRETHKQVITKAHTEYEKFREKQVDTLSSVERHFIESIEKLEKIN